MAKQIYPFAYIIQGDFAGMYVYYQDYNDKYFIRTESVHKDGMFSDGLWYKANYEYNFSDIIGYEDIGGATHSASATSVLTSGLMFGVVGAMAASAAGAGSTYDTVIYFKDGKKCVFRFLTSQVHQNHITSFHQLNIKPGDPSVLNSAQNTASVPATNGYITDANAFITTDEVYANGLSMEEYDLYLLGYTKELKDALKAKLVTAKFCHEEDNLDDIVGTKIQTVYFFEVRFLFEHFHEAKLGVLKAGTPKPIEASKPNSSAQQNTNNNSYVEELKQLKELLDCGIISQEEFDAKKKQLLGL